MTKPAFYGVVCEATDRPQSRHRTCGWKAFTSGCEKSVWRVSCFAQRLVRDGVVEWLKGYNEYDPHSCLNTKDRSSFARQAASFYAADRGGGVPRFFVVFALPLPTQTEMEEQKFIERKRELGALPRPSFRFWLSE